MKQQGIPHTGKDLAKLLTTHDFPIDSAARKQHSNMFVIPLVYITKDVPEDIYIQAALAKALESAGQCFGDITIKRDTREVDSVVTTMFATVTLTEPKFGAHETE